MMLSAGGREELPHFRGQGQRPRVPGCDGSGTAERSYPASEVGASAERSYLASEARGGSWEEPPTPEARPSGQEEQPKEWCLHRHKRA